MPRPLLALAFACFLISPALAAENASDNPATKAIEVEDQMAFVNEAIRAHPKYAMAYCCRSVLWLVKNDEAKAMADLNEAIRVDPTCAAAFHARGHEWSKKGEFEKALGDFNQAISVDPKFADAFSSRGFVWRQKGEYDKAIADYDKVIKLIPGDAMAYINRGNVWEKKGEYAKAIEDYNHALRLDDPNHIMAYMDIASLQATCPDQKCRDGKNAVVNATKAYQLDNGLNKEACLELLAAACAENGDFGKAREWQKKVIDIVANWPWEQVKKDARGRMELYKHNKPYRQEPRKK